MGALHRKSVGHPLDVWEDLLRPFGTTSKVIGSVLTEGTGAAGTSVATASVSPAANSLLLLTVATALSGGASAPSSVTGNGLTWVLVDGVALGNVRVDVFRALGAAPSAGAVTINYAVAQTNALWQVAQFANVDTTGTSGSGAVVQSAHGSANSTAVSAVLAAAPTAGNVVTGHLAHNSTSAAPTPGTGYSALGAQATMSTPSIKRWVEINSSPTDANVAATNPSAGNYGFVAVEIKAA